MLNLLCSLTVLTLLQLCRAEISDTLPEWYSANVINDGFQPKSISELFSTESSFSSTNPIIVLPKASTVPDDVLLLSTLGPPTQQVSFSTSTPSGFSKVSVTPLSPSTIPPTLPTQPPTSPTQPPSPTLPPFSTQTLPPTSIQTLPPTSIQTLPPTSIQTSPPSPSPTEPPSPAQDQLQETTVPIPQSTLFNQEAIRTQQQLQQIQFDVLPSPQAQPIPNVSVQFPGQPDQQPGAPRDPLSNFFLIYQQAPQNIQGFPAPEGPRGTPDVVIVNPPVTTPLPPTITVSSIPSIPSTSRPLPPTLQTNTPILNTNCPPQRLPVTTPRPTFDRYPLSIRVVAPVGSITNVKINPTTSTTTRRPTTTRTKRTKKPRRNTYERCVDACRSRDPICAIPLASTPIDVDTLKGFPSICHMACHNSYRRDPYEKLSDGRCGRLRTRIQAVGSKSKLTRDELNKAQYTVVSGPQTIVEFSALP